MMITWSRRTCLKSRSISCSSNQRYISFWKRSGNDKTSAVTAVEGEVQEDASSEELTKTTKSSAWSHLTPEEILRIRNKCTLPRDVVCEMKGIPPEGTRLTHINHYKRDWIKQYFGMYGKASGLKPGICWPSKEELEFRQKFEETFYPSLQTMVQEKKELKEQNEKTMTEYRKTILENLKKLPAAKKEFYRKFNEKKEQEEEERRKRERVVQEVREYLGYDVAPGDTRFQEALLKKEEEEQAVKRAGKKQEKQAKIMAALSALAEEQVKKAEETLQTASGGGEEVKEKEGDQEKKPTKESPPKEKTKKDKKTE